MKQQRVLGTFTLAMITMAAIVSLRNLSLIAGLGISAVFFLLAAALIFFIPSALIVAELAATWPHAGGCYVWVKEAFGKPLAFFTLWLSWMANVAWFPTILLFTSAMLAHMLQPVFPNLEQSQVFIMVCMLSIFWGSTLLNFLGIEISGLISSAGVLLGTVIPGVIIIALGFWWAQSGNDLHIPLTIPALIPSLNLDNLTLFAGVVLSLAGIELAAYHVREAKDPQRNYPKAVFMAAFAIMLIYVFGTLAIAIVVPTHELSLASGLVQAFAVFFSFLSTPMLIPSLAGCLLIGALASINAWVSGPAKGMLVAAQDGFFPKWLKYTNSKGVPTSLLLLQAIVGSVLSILYIYIKSNTFIWILTALSAQFTCLVYILIFCAAIKLRYSQSKVKRPFRVKGIWLFAISGIMACIFSFIIVYIPHSQFVFINTYLYNILLIATLIFLLIPPLILIALHRRSHKNS